MYCCRKTLVKFIKNMKKNYIILTLNLHKNNIFQTIFMILVHDLNYIVLNTKPKIYDVWSKTIKVFMFCGEVYIRKTWFRERAFGVKVCTDKNNYFRYLKLLTSFFKNNITRVLLGLETKVKQIYKDKGFKFISRQK